MKALNFSTIIQFGAPLTQSGYWKDKEKKYGNLGIIFQLYPSRVAQSTHKTDQLRLS